MCLELCDGGDLSVLLDDRLCNANPAPLSLTETRFYAACVLCALRAVHEGGFYFYVLVPLTFESCSQFDLPLMLNHFKNNLVSDPLYFY